MSRRKDRPAITEAGPRGSDGRRTADRRASTRGVGAQRVEPGRIVFVVLSGCCLRSSDARQPAAAERRLRELLGGRQLVAHDDLAPAGPKIVQRHRSVHLHLLGRSRHAKHPSWRWGEAPKFPDFADRFSWAETFTRLNPSECIRILTETERRLRDVYGHAADQINAWSPCDTCGYPMAAL